MHKDKIDNSENHVIVIMGYLKRALCKNICTHLNVYGVSKIDNFEKDGYLIIAVDKKFDFVDLCSIITSQWEHIILDSYLNIIIDTDGILGKDVNGSTLETYILGNVDFKEYLMYKKDKEEDNSTWGINVNTLNDDLSITSGLKEKYNLNDIAFLKEDTLHVSALLKKLLDGYKIDLKKSYIYSNVLGDKFCLFDLKEEMNISDALLFIKSDSTYGDFPFMANEVDEVYDLEEDEKKYYDKLSSFAKEDIYSKIYGAENITDVVFI